MKKIVKMLLLCSLLVLSVVMVGCGGSSSTNNGGNSNDSNKALSLSPPEWIYGDWRDRRDVYNWLWFDESGMVLVTNDDNITSNFSSKEYVYYYKENIDTINKSYIITIQFLKSNPQRIYKFEIKGEGENEKLIYTAPNDKEYILTKESNSDSN